jgi:RNA polymerase sigma-70 factor (ECF subfamily)
VDAPTVNKPPFDEVVDRYYDNVYNLAFRLMGDYEEARDLTQEVFIHAFQAYDRFRGDAQVFTWLYRITVNLWKNRIKQLQREREHRWEVLPPDELDEEDEDAEPFEWEDTRLSPERLLEQKELSEAIQRAIDELPEDQRAALVLCDIEGLSYKEIAQMLGCSVEAVKSRLFRARSTLRKKLRPFLER